MNHVLPEAKNLDPRRIETPQSLSVIINAFDRDFKELGNILRG